MMPSKELKDVLLDSSDVTALSSGDRVLISDINGVPKRIDRNTFLNFGSSQTKTVTPGATGWLRVATVGFSSSGIIKVAKTWGATSPAAIIFAYCIHCNGRFFLQCLSRLHDDGMFAKIRVVKKHNTGGFLDVYAPITGNETISVDLIGSLDEISFGNSSNADIPEGYSAVVFTPANWGGG